MKNYVVVYSDEDGARVGNIESYVIGSLSSLFLRMSRDVLLVEDHERITNVSISRVSIDDL